jgi:(E)-4-hydroxy-3-methylbut-2-enyl-diphosphate synthase
MIAMGNKKYISVPVMVGNLPMGGEWPIRIQSMTNTDTLDTEASVAQCIRIIEAGGELVRLTAQGIREAENLANIKEKLRKAGYDTPLVADIHFNPDAAERAATIVEKVRINPGNYADKRAQFVKVDLTEKEFSEELERIHSRLLPLIDVCRCNNTVIRVGINHGSLSDRIMSRYGNTPEGMTASAMEFIKIFRAENFNNLILSMKSSDTVVMVDATRKLVDAMTAEGYCYPLHLGVTEAGEGEDGRIRSAVGIGTLLAEGIGDTIRVSLSEPPEDEIPVAREILNSLGDPSGRVLNVTERLNPIFSEEPYRPEVVTFKNGLFWAENENPYNGQVAIVGSTPSEPLRFMNCEEGKSAPTEDENIPSSNVADNLTNTVICYETEEIDRVKAAINAAVTTGRYFIARKGAGICIKSGTSETFKELSFAILQASEARITGNRYISCPTCGRTKYNLQIAVKKVKEATKHLTGLKIAIMGCIVNGPGEMAGADYGYVGAGEGKIHIYKGSVPVLKNIPEKDAVNRLLEIIEGDIRAANNTK